MVCCQQCWWCTWLGGLSGIEFVTQWSSAWLSILVVLVSKDYWVGWAQYNFIQCKCGAVHCVFSSLGVNRCTPRTRKQDTPKILCGFYNITGFVWGSPQWAGSTKAVLVCIPTVMTMDKPDDSSNVGGVNGLTSIVTMCLDICGVGRICDNVNLGQLLNLDGPTVTHRPHTIQSL